MLAMDDLVGQLSFTDDIISRINKVLDDGQTNLGDLLITETTPVGMSRTPGGLSMAKESLAAREAALSALKDIAVGLQKYRDGIAKMIADTYAVDGTSRTTIANVPVPTVIDEGAACTTQPSLDDPSLTCTVPESDGGEG